MGKTYVIDFETFWSNAYTLSKMGPIEYIRDQRFVPQLLAAMRIVNQYELPKGLVTDNIENMRAFLKRADKSAEDPITLVGHNIAGFDALILSEYFNVRPAFLIDTITMMNWIGYSRIIPRSHAALTELLGNGTKKAGTVVSCGKQWPQDFSPEEQQFFVQYCHDDAFQCAENLLQMMPHMSSDALLFGHITARMATEPIFELDEKLLEEYIAEIDAKVAQARKDLLSIFHFPTEEAFLQAIRSSAKFAVMLASLGVEPPMKESEAKTKTKKAQLEMLMEQATTEAERATLRQRMETELPVMTYAFSKTDLPFLALREHPDMRVQMLVNARLDHNTSIDRSRAERLLFFARQHKPIPIMLSAFNAHTGRYTAGAAEEGGSSDKLQFQNLSKRDPSKAKLRQTIHAPTGYKVVACDSSQVEARCLAWAANETGLVTQFREGRDPYSELAEMIFQVPHEEIHYGAKHGDKRLKMYRNVGKTAILSCLAGTVEVLTDTGWKRIDTVSINDKVWDGESWVNHEGLICNGWRNTINVAGISMTPDHLLFDGSSWRTAAELLDEPQYLKSATAWANVSYETVLSTQAKDTTQFGFLQLAPIVTLNIGTKGTLWLQEILARCASTARRVTQSILRVSNDALQTLKSALSLGNLQSLTTTDTSMCHPMGENALNTAHWCSVLAVQNPIGFFNPIYAMVEQHGAMLARREKREQRRIKTTGGMLILSPMLQCADACSIVLLPVSLDAVLPRTSVRLGNTMVVEESEWSSRTVGLSLNILLPCRDMMTRLWNWTASTAMATMHRVISALFPGQRTCSTSAMLRICRPELTTSKETNRSLNGALEPCSTNYQKVYDLKNCGPNNRFLIRQGTTMLMAHNCGYGVGARKFSDTLARQGARLSDDPDKHREMAFNAHAVYRAAHPNIVKFWDLCGRVVRGMEAGYSGEFGGPDGKLFKFGTKEMGSCGRQVPYVLLPNGYHLWYPNLRVEADNGKAQYFYDRPRGKNVIKTRIYGGALTENCIAEGTEVFTSNGWKPIETIEETDLVYDGVDYVTHSGVVCKGVQQCIAVNGAWMTPDHKILEGGMWVHAKDIRRPDRAAVREACSSKALPVYTLPSVLGMPLRVWSYCDTQGKRAGKSETPELCICVSGMCSQENQRTAEYTWHVQDSAVCSLAQHEVPLSMPYALCIQAIRRAWHNSVSAVAGFLRELSGRYGSCISGWFGAGPDRQRRAVLPGELSLDYVQGEQQKQEGGLRRRRRCSFERSYWSGEDNYILEDSTGVAVRDAGCACRLPQRSQGISAETCEATCAKKVYDILNCGPRHRFVIRGAYPMIAHNCIQSLAFMVLMWQACRMHEAGIRLAANIHDSFATVVPEEQAEETAKKMEHYMSMCPEWASTLPIACESEIGRDFGCV